MTSACWQVATVAAIVLATLAPVRAAAQERSSLLKNGNFEEWRDEGPVDWQIEIGAYHHNRQEPASTIAQGDGRCLELTGDASTMAWNMVSQTVPVEPGSTYRLRYEAQADNVRREAIQFDNCYVGAFLLDAGGNPVNRLTWPVLLESWTSESNVFSVPRGVANVRVIVFLSKSGTLRVRDVGLERLDAADSFDILVEDMDRHYSFFEHKGIDWQDLVSRHRDSVKAAATPAAFAKSVGEMLGELKDLHIWVEVDGKRVHGYVSRYDANYDFAEVDRDLEHSKPVRGLGLTGTTRDGIGYVRILSLVNVEQPSLEALVAEIRKMKDGPGLIIDLRANQGGAETVAQAIAALFVEEPLVYARQKFRVGAGHDEFAETAPRRIVPQEGSSWNKPVVCLIGPGTVSSGEGMAMMFAAMPDATLVGQPTRGASGNPQPVPLPNGVTVWYSRWVSMLPDGTPIEDSGVPPDIVVEGGEGDAAWRKALELLRD